MQRVVNEGDDISIIIWIQLKGGVAGCSSEKSIDN